MTDINELRAQLFAIQMHTVWLLVQYFRTLPDPIAAANARKEEVDYIAFRFLEKDPNVGFTMQEIIEHVIEDLSDE